MAMPVLTGRKTDSERFAGALRTYSCEAMMQDGKALQAGTSHDLGQNFAKAFDMTFQTAAGDLEHVWTTSWGVSTRLVGGLIMTHGDDRPGVPPRLAPYQVVIVPIYKTDEERATVLEAADRLRKELAAGGSPGASRRPGGMKPGAKYYEWEGRGVPLRLEIGPRDVASSTVSAGPPHRRQEGDPPDGRDLRSRPRRAWIRCRRSARRRRSRGVRRRASGEPPRSSSSPRWRRGRLRLRRLLWARPPARRRSRSRPRPRSGCLPDEEFRSPVAPTTCMWCGRPSVAEAVWAKAY